MVLAAVLPVAGGAAGPAAAPDREAPVWAGECGSTGTTTLGDRPATTPAATTSQSPARRRRSPSRTSNSLRTAICAGSRYLLFYDARPSRMRLYPGRSLGSSGV